MDKANFKFSGKVDEKVIKEILKNKVVIQFINENKLGKQEILDNLPVFHQFNNFENNMYLPKLEFRNGFAKLKIIPTKQNIANSNINNNLWFGTLQDYSIDFDALSSNKNQIREILEIQYRQLEGPGIYFWGGYGIGKTFSFQILANQLLLQNQSVGFATTTEIFNGLKNEMRSNYMPQLMEKLENVDNLFIDDLGMENVTNWSIETLTSLLNYRWQNQKRTFFSSNFTMRELLASYAKRLESNNYDLISLQKTMLRLEARIKGMSQPYNFEKLIESGK
jgi:DNA replication protein DnaC